MRCIALLIVVVVVTACAGGSRSAPVPALLLAPTADGHAELEAAAATLVGTPSMTLADAAFLLDPYISVELRPARGVDGPVDGRRRTPPVRLRLERDGDGCLLRRLDSGASMRLARVRCAAVAARQDDA